MYLFNTILLLRDRVLIWNTIFFQQAQELCVYPVNCKLTSVYAACVVDENKLLTEYNQTTSQYENTYDYNYYEEAIYDSHELNVHNKTETITLELDVYNEIEYDIKKKEYLLEANFFVYG